MDIIKLSNNVRIIPNHVTAYQPHKYLNFNTTIYLSQSGAITVQETVEQLDRIFDDWKKNGQR